jgi:glycosyltransferase involved in cell wall biosynthesis
MRVCQVLAGAEDGGLEKHTIELTYELIKQGIDVTVIAHEKYLNDFIGIKFIALDLAKGRNNLLILWKLYQILKKEQFDIIHTQANKATAMVVKIKPFLDVKVVSTLHNVKKNLVSYRKADAMITVSDRIGKNFHHVFKRTVYNGIKVKKNCKIDIHHKFDIDEDRYIVCCVGRLVEAKGFDLLIESLQYMHKDIHVLLIGDGPLREKLENSAHQLRVEHKVSFLGNLDSELTQNIISASDLLLISSRREGFSYVFAESLLLHTPLISTDVADIKKFVTDKFIVPFDAKDLADAVTDFMTQYRFYMKEYQSIFKYAENTFTVSRMAQKTKEIYEKVLI